VEQTIPFSRDLRVAAFQHDPPTTYQTKSGPGFKSYSMDALGERYLGVPKSDLGKALAKEYGGWDHIPADDPRYAEYLRADLDLTRRLDQVIPWDPYEAREAWVATITARITLSGFRADVAGLQERVQALAERAARGRTMLADGYGFPLTNKAGKEAKAPQRTKAGKAAFEAALTSLGFPNLHVWPRGKDGSLSMGKEVIEHALEHARKWATAAVPAIEAVQEMNGIRNSAANVLSHVTDGRAHYTFEPFQSTGRWSFGLTVLKKGTEDSEREFLIAEEGHLLGTIDLDQIDIRCVAAHSQDHALIALLNDPSRDIHTEISGRAGVPRKQGKTLDLGWLYGRTVNGLAQTPGMTRDAAERVDAYMRSEFGRVMRWQNEVRERGGAGLLLDNGFGRHLRVEAERAFTQAPALMGQSTTRDLIAEGLLDIARTAPEILPLLRGLAHDEVIFSAPEKDFEEVARIVQKCITRQWAPAGASYPVSITAGNGKPFVSGKTWNSLYM
jgi:DNA polymerase-1